MKIPRSRRGKIAVPGRRAVIGRSSERWTGERSDGRAIRCRIRGCLEGAEAAEAAVWGNHRAGRWYAVVAGTVRHRWAHGIWVDALWKTIFKRINFCVSRHLYAFKWANPTSFYCFRSFSNKQYNFYIPQMNVKNIYAVYGTRIRTQDLSNKSLLT